MSLQTRGAELPHTLPCEERQITGGRAGKPQPELHHHSSDEQPGPLSGGWVENDVKKQPRTRVFKHDTSVFMSRWWNVLFFSSSCEWGVAPAGSVQAAAADRAPPTGELARGKGEVSVSAARHGQRPRPVVHVQLSGSRGSQGLQWSTVGSLGVYIILLF